MAIHKEHGTPAAEKSFHWMKCTNALNKGIIGLSPFPLEGLPTLYFPRSVNLTRPALINEVDIHS